MAPELRANVDKVYTFKTHIVSQRKRLYDYFFGAVPTFKEFSDLMATKDYGCLKIDNSKHVSEWKTMKAPFSSKNHLNDSCSFYRSAIRLRPAVRDLRLVRKGTRDGTGT